MKNLFILIALSLGLSADFYDTSGLGAAKDKYGAKHCTNPIGFQDAGIGIENKVKGFGAGKLNIETLKNSGLPPANQEYFQSYAKHGAAVVSMMAKVYGTNGKIYFSNVLSDHSQKSYDVEFFAPSGVGVINRSLGGGYIETKIIYKFENLLLSGLRDGLGGILVTAAGNDEESIDESSRWRSYKRLKRVVVVGFLNENGERTESDFPATSGFGRNVIYLRSYGPEAYYPKTLNSRGLNQMTTSRATAFVSGNANLALCINPKLTGDELENIIRVASPRNEYGYFTLVPVDILRFAHALEWEANPTDNIKGNVSLAEVMSTLKELRKILPLVKFNKNIKPGWNLLGLEREYSLTEFKKFVNIEDDKIYTYKTGDLILRDGKLDIEPSQWVEYPQGTLTGGIWIRQNLSGEDKYELSKRDKRSLPEVYKK